jgi:hypothetical protein
MGFSPWGGAPAREEKAMEVTVVLPCADLVTDACKSFDCEFAVTEKALSELFAQFPSNREPSHVLLKVVALNRLYSAGILAVLEMAEHIHKMGDAVDSALAVGSPEIVDGIARVEIQKRDFCFYSFATKYCSWHRPGDYPIYDSRVDKFLWLLKKQGSLKSQHFSHHDDLYKYPVFRAIMDDLRDQYGLRGFSFKQIDKFLWAQGEALFPPAARGLQRYLDMAPDAPPDPGDELPEGWTPQ